MTSLRGV